jgi:hypothetical protein
MTATTITTRQDTVIYDTTPGVEGRMEIIEAIREIRHGPVKAVGALEAPAEDNLIAVMDRVRGRDGDVGNDWRIRLASSLLGVELCTRCCSWGTWGFLYRAHTRCQFSFQSMRGRKEGRRGEAGLTYRAAWAGPVCGVRD